MQNGDRLLDLQDFLVFKSLELDQLFLKQLIEQFLENKINVFFLAHGQSQKLRFEVLFERLVVFFQKLGEHDRQGHHFPSPAIAVVMNGFGSYFLRRKGVQKLLVVLSWDFPQILLT